MSLGKGIAVGCAFAGATLLAATGKDGWGWLIFAGILVSGS